MFVTIYFENVLQFCGIWKKYCLRSLTLGAIGAKTWFFKMWPKSMHDQKFGTFYSLRPEDGLYGSNEPKKCEIRPVASSIVHFKVFKSYFIYIIDICAFSLRFPFERENDCNSQFYHLCVDKLVLGSGRTSLSQKKSPKKERCKETGRESTAFPSTLPL